MQLASKILHRFNEVSHGDDRVFEFLQITLSKLLICKKNGVTPNKFTSCPGCKLLGNAVGQKYEIPSLFLFVCGLSEAYIFSHVR